MASVKLTAHMRNAIVKTALDRALADDEAAITKLEERREILNTELSTMAYEAIYTAKERKILKDAPIGWFKEAKIVNVRLGDTDEQISFPDPKPVPYKHGKSYSAVFAAALEVDHPMTKKFEEYREICEQTTEAQTDRQTKRKALKLKIEPVVGSVTTVARLLDVWPEVKELLPDGWENSNGGVPAIVVADLNKAVGLPSKKEAA